MTESRRANLEDGELGGAGRRSRGAVEVHSSTTSEGLAEKISGGLPVKWWI